MSDVESPLLDRIRSGDATIGVLGLGYVGLPLSLEFAAAGYDVSGYDIDEERVGRLQRADSYVGDVPDDVLEDGLAEGFEPSADPASIRGSDVFVVAVPTDVWNRAPDLSAVQAASKTVAEQAGDGEILVVVTSTVHPGATREIVEPIVTTERPAGSTHVAMVPERLDPGSGWALSDIPIVVGADTDPARETARALFESIVTEVHPVDSTATAELTKTLENTYRMVNIALVNELALLSEHTRADLWAAIDAASTKPFGFEAFYPGPGVGGHCIPVDPQFLTWRARDAGTELSLVEGANDVNLDMPAAVVDRVRALLSDRGIDHGSTRVVALGASYKSNVADVRNSPALEVISGLAGATDLTVVDPLVEPSDVSAAPAVGTIDDLPFDLADAELAVLLVDHDHFDLEALSRRAPLVFDTRNVVPRTNEAEVVRLGDPRAGQRTDPSAAADEFVSGPDRSQRSPTTED